MDKLWHIKKKVCKYGIFKNIISKKKFVNMAY